jgi:hypothetical protein
MKRFNSFKELGKLIPLDNTIREFTVSQEEYDFYVSLLLCDQQEYLKQTGQTALYRGVKLIVE